jgi:hypothetical protein
MRSADELCIWLGIETISNPRGSGVTTQLMQSSKLEAPSHVTVLHLYPSVH